MRRSSLSVRVMMPKTVTGKKKRICQCLEFLRVALVSLGKACFSTALRTSPQHACKEGGLDDQSSLWQQRDCEI